MTEDRGSLVAPIFPLNYFQNVFDNREVGRLVSVLMSSVSSMKKVRLTLSSICDYHYNEKLDSIGKIYNATVAKRHAGDATTII